MRLLVLCLAGAACYSPDIGGDGAPLDAGDGAGPEDGEPGPDAPPGPCLAGIAVGFHHSCYLRGDGRVYCWGDDATGMALDYLADPHCFERGEYARITALPQAVQRRRG